MLGVRWHRQSPSPEHLAQGGGGGAIAPSELPPHLAFQPGLGHRCRRSSQAVALDVEKTRGCIQGLSEAQNRHERPAALGPLEISVTPSVPLDADTVKAFEDLGVHRLVVIGRGRSKQKLLAFVEGMGAELI